MSKTPNVYDFLHSIEQAAGGIREEVPGWRIRRPLLTEVAERITFVVAESKPEEDVPFILPRAVEACVCVIEGSVSLDGAPGPIRENTFWTVHGNEGRAITSLVHPSRIFVLFFKGGEEDEQRAVDSR